jgi:hypothetical protein
LLAQVLFATFVELVLIQVRGQIPGVVLVGWLGVVLVPDPAEAPFDPLALGLEKLACPVGIHAARD